MFGLFKARKPLPEIEPGSASESQLHAVLPRAERENCYKEIHVISSTGYHCRGIVIDQSDTGIRIRFQSHETLTDYVTLNCPDLKIKGAGRVAWQDGVDIGIEILGAPQVAKEF
tara:strand:- start:27140 stop:27481 length:342 start_codon:yes stop_codon:yes gene_type:complete